MERGQRPEREVRNISWEPTFQGDAGEIQKGRKGIPHFPGNLESNPRDSANYPSGSAN